MRLLEQTWSGIPGTIYTRPHILFYSSGLSLSSCDLPPFPVFANVLNSSSSPPCLPYSLLLWTALFGSVFGLWRPRGSHAVFSSQSAVFPSPMPRPCYTQHTHKHTLSITLLYSLSACPSLSTSLSASFPSCPSPPFSAPTPICYPAKCNVCQRHRVDTHTKRKRRKKMRAGASSLFYFLIFPPSLALAFCVESAGQKWESLRDCFRKKSDHHMNSLTCCSENTQYATLT